MDNIGCLNNLAHGNLWSHGIDKSVDWLGWEVGVVGNGLVVVAHAETLIVDGVGSGVVSGRSPR